MAARTNRFESNKLATRARQGGGADVGGTTWHHRAKAALPISFSSRSALVDGCSLGWIFFVEPEFGGTSIAAMVGAPDLPTVVPGCG